MPRASILIFTDWFAPAYKAGGPIRSCYNFTYAMRLDYNIYILTSDKDLGGKEPLTDVISDQWINFDEGIKICYLSKDEQIFKGIKKRIEACQPDYIYINSMFSVSYALKPLYIINRNIHNAKVILAPRGMLKNSALKYKPIKKNIFLTLLKWSQVPKKIIFHATNQLEKREILDCFGKVEVYVVQNFPTPPCKQLVRISKKTNQLKLIFLSRIHSIKNLSFLLSELNKVSTKFAVYLKIVGYIDNQLYWEQCQQIIKELPSHIDCEYIGEVLPSDVEQILQDAHVFILPTKGENFGHAIFESFAAGRPVIISDQTPWRNLEEKKIGWDVSLSQPEQFVAAIEKVAAIDQEEYNVLTESAWQFAKDFIEHSNLKEKYSQLFS